VSRVLVKAARSLAVPETFSANQALRSHALTVQYLVAEYRGVRPGDRVLVDSAAGASVDLAFDSVGAATLVATLNGSLPAAPLSPLAEASAPPPAIAPSLLTPRARRLAGGSFSATSPTPPSCSVAPRW
jgi:hypothetical protein